LRAAWYFEGSTPGGGVRNRDPNPPFAMPPGVDDGAVPVVEWFLRGNVMPWFAMQDRKALILANPLPELGVVVAFGETGDADELEPPHAANVNTATTAPPRTIERGLANFDAIPILIITLGQPQRALW